MTDTIGAQRPNDPRGWLMFDSLPDDLARLEDQRLHADHEHIREDVLTPYTFNRAATDTERTLLAHLGYTVPGNLQTRVCWLSYGVRNRRWPQLEGQETGS
jgi:hypothetical protein